jgi:hypothetical protein
MNDERVLALVDELDAQVPREGALVRFEQYGGGPDESKVVANRAGYFRLGIEFLKGGLAPFNPGKNADLIEVEIEYLLDAESNISFDWFERTEQISRQPARNQSPLTQHVLGLTVAAVLITLLVCAAVGAWTILGWLVSGR